MRISDWSSDECSSDLRVRMDFARRRLGGQHGFHHAALAHRGGIDGGAIGDRVGERIEDLRLCQHDVGARRRRAGIGIRSEEHTSELQSLMRTSYAVFCLKKNKKKASRSSRRKSSEEPNYSPTPESRQP